MHWSVISSSWAAIIISWNLFEPNTSLAFQPPFGPSWALSATETEGALSFRPTAFRVPFLCLWLNFQAEPPPFLGICFLALSPPLLPSCKNACLWLPRLLLTTGSRGLGRFQGGGTPPGTRPSGRPETGPSRGPGPLLPQWLLQGHECPAPKSPWSPPRASLRATRRRETTTAFRRGPRPPPVPSSPPGCLCRRFWRSGRGEQARVLPQASAGATSPAHSSKSQS